MTLGVLAVLVVFSVNGVGGSGQHAAGCRTGRQTVNKAAGGSGCRHIATSSISQHIPSAISCPVRITQPDGSTAIVPAAPKRIVVVDFPEFAVDHLVGLGVRAEIVDGESNITGVGAGETDAAGVPWKDTRYGLTGVTDAQWTTTGNGSVDLDGLVLVAVAGHAAQRVLEPDQLPVRTLTVPLGAPCFRYLSLQAARSGLRP